MSIVATLTQATILSYLDCKDLLSVFLNSVLVLLHCILNRVLLLKVKSHRGTPLLKTLSDFSVLTVVDLVPIKAPHMMPLLSSVTSSPHILPLANAIPRALASNTLGMFLLQGLYLPSSFLLYAVPHISIWLTNPHPSRVDA